MAEKEEKKKKVIIIVGIGVIVIGAILLYNHLRKKDGTTQADNSVLKDVYDNLVFLTGTATIKPESFPALDELAETMIKSPLWNLTISGHTDSTGTPKGNLLLSQKRADAVKQYLVNKGVGSDRIATNGFGQERPIADNKTAEGREKNRRVEFLITK